MTEDIRNEFLVVEDFPGCDHLITVELHLVEVIGHRHLALLGGSEGDTGVDGARLCL